MNVEVSLTSLFGDYQSDQRMADWAGLRTQLSVGERVTGKVVARYPFGVFLDIGVGFPALILVPDFEGAAERPYISMDMYPAVGATVSGTLLRFAENLRQIRLIQRTLAPEELATIGLTIR